MLQSYSEVLAKIHTSVRSLGGRLEEIEHTRSKKVKAYKKKLARAVEKYREIEKRCMIAEKLRERPGLRSSVLRAV